MEAQLQCRANVSALVRCKYSMERFQITARVFYRHAGIIRHDPGPSILRRDNARQGIMTRHRTFRFRRQDVFGPAIKRATIARQITVGHPKGIYLLSINPPAIVRNYQLVMRIVSQLRELARNVVNVVSREVNRRYKGHRALMFRIWVRIAMRIKVQVTSGRAIIFVSSFISHRVRGTSVANQRQGPLSKYKRRTRSNVQDFLDDDMSSINAVTMRRTRQLIRHDRGLTAACVNGGVSIVR